MSFVKPVTENEATGETSQLYALIRKGFGKVPNWFQALGSRPDVIRGVLQLDEAVFQDGALPRSLKEQIGLVVAGINHSSYCVAIHSEILQRFGIPRPVARTLTVDYPSAQVSAKEMALFRFAEKLTRDPDSIEPSDAEELRRHGWDDAAILEAVQTIAMMNYFNRVSAGMGLMVDF